ncbi:MAG: hypothetical protein CFH20_00957, partial [Alphaproteobacteria bacterium MarineAlpha5_Bin10]
MTVQKKLDNILDRYSIINKKLSEESPKNSEELINLNKEFAKLQPLVAMINEQKKLNKE